MKHKDKRKTVFVPVIAFIILLIIIFLFRGWIRGSFIPNQVSHSAKQSLSKSYGEAYASAKPAIDTLQFALPSTAVASCSMLQAEKLDTIVDCSVSTGGSKLPDKTYQTFFKGKSIEAEKQLLNNGWTKVWNAVQPIDELFKDPNNKYTIGVNYQKKYDNNTCELSLTYNAWENPKTAHYYLNCQRSIHYFWLFFRSTGY